MAKDPHVCTTILTSYRTVAHLVGSVLLLLFILQECFNTYGYYNNGYIILYTSLVTVPECIKGLLLLYSILKENTITLKIYLVVSCIMLLILKGLAIYYVILVIRSAYYYVDVWLFVSFTFYFTFEWFVFYHVCRLHKNLVNHVNNEGLRSEQVMEMQPEIIISDKM